ncbi:NUDIX domain-containing protein [Candidatus Dojkabacteria bacterium]|jgi:8-oxo-dGTP pyrophosphatase MutT (NUDIX family)|nr:NUDIX domain-containing protein [Candidatus Dojkabacteria bacterium]
MEATRIWYENNQISPEHIDLEVKQIYVWVISKDNMIAIVTKSNGESQFPGGHPEQGENPVETAVREVNEEAGLNISPYISELIQFGYYLIEKADEKYLQLRYLLKLPKKSQESPLFMNEKSEEERPVESAQWVELAKLSDYIPWTKGLEEYINAIELVSSK